MQQSQHAIVTTKCYHTIKCTIFFKIKPLDIAKPLRNRLETTVFVKFTTLFRVHNYPRVNGPFPLIVLAETLWRTLLVSRHFR